MRRNGFALSSLIMDWAQAAKLQNRSDRLRQYLPGDASGEQDALQRTPRPLVIESSLRRSALALLLAMFIFSPALQAQFNYAISNGTVIITRYTGSGSEAAIPSTIDNLPVTTIGDYAFQGYGNLTGVLIPEGVTSIGNYAFQWCGGLSSLAIPDSVTNVASHAFDSCYGLTSITFGNGLANIGDYAFASCGLLSVTLPDSVGAIGSCAFEGCSATNVAVGQGLSSIGYRAFHGCASLIAITVDALNPTYRSAEGVLFDKSCATLIQFPAARPGNYTVPSTVSTIADSAFYRCLGLTSITLPETLTNIEDNAFYSCFGLTAITIPDGVVRIGSFAFEGCFLTNASIGKSLISIGNWAFGDCQRLTAITVDPQNSTYSSADGVVFDKNQTTLILCPAGRIGDYVIPGSVTTIAHDAFYACLSLTSVTIPISVTNIGPWSFYYCSRLTGLYFEGNPPTLGGSAFYYANQLTIYYPAQVEGWRPQIETAGTGIGILTNRVGFSISGTPGLGIVVGASTNLSNSIWIPLATNTLYGSKIYFRDAESTNYPARFYRPWSQSFGGRPLAQWNP